MVSEVKQDRDGVRKSIFALSSDTEKQPHNGACEDRNVEIERSNENVNP